jgi:hypothetical protein
MRVGVIGLGRIGRMHARNFAQTPGVDEVVLIGRDPERTAHAQTTIQASLQPGAPRSPATTYPPPIPPAYGRPRPSWLRYCPSWTRWSSRPSPQPIRN